MFFSWGDGGGKEELKGACCWEVFTGRTGSKQSCLCYILYVEQWRFHCSMSSDHRERGFLDPRMPWTDIQYIRPIQMIHTRNLNRTRADAVKSTYLKSSCSREVEREQRPNDTPHRNVTYVIRDALRTTQNNQEHHSPFRAMVQDYPVSDPSPGTNPPIYPSSLPLSWGNLLSNIFPKNHWIFFFSRVWQQCRDLVDKHDLFQKKEKGKNIVGSGSG